MDIYTVAFFGHRYIDNPFRIEDRLEEEIRRLLSEHEYVDFLVGRDGDFDQFASSAVLRIRKQYRDDNSSLVLVLPYARAEYLNNEESITTITATWKYPMQHRRHIPRRRSKSETVKWLIVPTLSSAVLSVRKAVPGRQFSMPSSKKNGNKPC